MRIIFLGTNGWYDTPTGNTVSVAIDASSHILVLDAGVGIVKLDRYVTQDRPAYLFLSHLHLDHIAGLHALGAFDFAEGLFICGQEGLSSILGRVLDAPFTLPLKDLRFRTSFVELPREEGSVPFAVKSLPLVHSVLTLGYRFGIDGKTVAYVGDTGYCLNAVELAKDADLLIAECAYGPGEEHPEWPHLNPESAARIALESGAKRLVLVHFDARVYPTMESRRHAGDCAREIFPDTTAAEDGMVITV
jgi:ribonuclease BN (tRNA processing enzyme)